MKVHFCLDKRAAWKNVIPPACPALQGSDSQISIRYLHKPISARGKLSRASHIVDDKLCSLVCPSSDKIQLPAPWHAMALRIYCRIRHTRANTINRKCFNGRRCTPQPFSRPLPQTPHQCNLLLGRPDLELNVSPRGPIRGLGLKP